MPLNMDEVLEQETPLETATQQEPKSKEQEEEKPKIQFKCGSCTFHEDCDYFGKLPPFANKIKFNESCYVMKDPFAPSPEQAKTTNSEYFIALGGHCVKCNQAVCRGQECSFHYLKTYCLACASSSVKMFPVEVQTKIKKQIAMNQSR